MNKNKIDYFIDAQKNLSFSQRTYSSLRNVKENLYTILIGVCN